MKHKKKHRFARVNNLLFFLCIAIFLAFPLVCMGDDIVKTIEVGDHTIFVEQKEDLTIQETLLFNYTVYYHTGNSSGGKKPLSYNESLYFWISDKSKDLAIECQGLDVIFHRPAATNITINLGENNLSIPLNGHLMVNLSYSLPPPFDKKLVYKTNALVITLAAEDYPRGDIPIHYDSMSNTYVSILGEQASSFSFTLDFVSSSSSSMRNMFFLILLGLVILLVLIILYILLRPKNNQIRKEPTESLKLRKKLLMDLLKTLEIERSKGRVPDTYYSVIKNDYKKEAVKVIQEIEKRK